MKIQILALVLGLCGLGAALGLLSSDASANSNARVSHHGNGQVKESTIFIDGLRHGWTERWYADGTLRAKGQHDHGKMVGEWVWQMPDGSLDQSRAGTYEAGKKISG